MQPRLMALTISGMSMVLASCASNGYVYLNHVNSSGGDSYLEVPQNWTIFNQSQIFKVTSAGVPASVLHQLEAQSWSNIFAGKSGATLESSSGLTSTIPYGITQQMELTSSQSASVSLASLRQVLLPSDPLATGASSGGLSYQVLSYREFTAPSGFRGSTLEVKMIFSKTSASILYQKAYLDPKKTWIYFIGIGCTAKCFSANKAVIEHVVNSWNVKEQ